MSRLFLLLHYIGMGILLTSIIAAPIFERNIRKASEKIVALTYQRLFRQIGLLSPFGSLIVLLSGIGNMYFDGYTVFSHGWLTAKIILFAVLVVNGGMVNPPLMRKRTALIEQMVEGNTRENAEEILAKYNRQQSTFLLVQTVVIIVILYLAVFKPV
ncbi:MAG: DUF2269 family protein [Bacteroidota bacterium]